MPANHTFEQTTTDVTLTIDLPEGTRGRDLMVVFKPKHLSVKIAKTQEVLVEGELSHDVKPADCMWQIESGKLEVYLEKLVQMQDWWRCVFIGDQEIDTTKIQPENAKLGDLDPTTRATVEKMMFDQQQKAQGLPTSEEIQKKKMLQGFMDQHPEMDFSKAKIN
eukprot:TRINITY_DN16946_c0_g1_i1.p1 TRINITY_DN16946_c0_g1~~TRINITY_DN16946_c0_g1_i1.p1  ORF type:complete len:164 (+),score=56.33 TRINITY_DN16946_c0_g1_i1:55-546(+)